MPIQAKVNSLLSRLPSPLLAFLFFLSVFVFTNQGTIQSTDGKLMYLLTQSMVEENRLSFVTDIALDPKTEVPGEPGRHYSKYGWGLSLWAIPFYLAGKGASEVLGMDPKLGTAFTVTMMNAVVSALTCMFVFLIGRDRLQLGMQASFILSLAYGLTTTVWVYSQDFMSEPITSLLLTAAVYGISSTKSMTSNRLLLIVGSLLGMALLTRLATLVLIPGFFLYLVLKQTAPKRNLNSIIKNGTLLGGPMIVFLLVILYYNFIRFGGPLETGYEQGFNGNMLVGIYGLLISPGKSLFLYCPVIIISCLKFRYLFLKNRPLAALCAYLIISNLILYSFWGNWHGGITWGPRFMVPVLPFLVLPVGYLWIVDPLRFQKPIFALCAIGFAIQVMGVSVNMSRYYYHMKAEYGERYHELLLHSPGHSPLLGRPGEVIEVFGHLGNADILKSLADNARSRKSFMGAEPREILDKGLAVNAPNFWWLYMWILGYPFYITLFPAGCLFLFQILSLKILVQSPSGIP